MDRLYQPIPADPQGLLASPILGLRLGVHEGLLRFFDESGAPIPTLPEVIDQEQALVRQQRALVKQQQALVRQEQALVRQEQERANQERLRADRLAERLRALGIDPEFN